MTKIYTLKIRKLGGSFYISLPPEVIDALDLQIGSELEMHLMPDYAFFQKNEKNRKPIIIKQVGGSIISNIPAQLMHAWNMKAGQSVILTIKDNQFSIKPFKRNYDLKSLLIENLSLDLPKNSWLNVGNLND